MTNRRKFIAGLGALATGSAAAMGTGAFTQTNATREISVEVSGDASAYLGLKTNSSYGDYAETTGDGELTIDLDGVSQDAEAIFNGLFTIENNVPDASGDLRVTLIKYDSNGNEILGGTNNDGDLVSGERVRFFSDWSYPPAEGDRIDKIGETIRVGYTDIPTGQSVDVSLEVSTDDSAPAAPHYLEGAEFADSEPAENDVLVDHIEILAQQSE